MAYPTISRYVNRALEDTNAISTAFEESAVLFMAAGKEKKKGEFDKSKVKRLSGPDFEFPVRNRERQAAMFLPGAASDVIGDPTSATTYPHREAVNVARGYFGMAKAPIRISKIELKRAKSRRQLIPFMQNQMDGLTEDAIELLAEQIMLGKGNGAQSTLPGVTGSTAIQLYGLLYQDRVCSNASGNNTDNDTTNTHFGLVRSAQPEFIANYMSTLTEVGAPTITMAACTLTAGHTEVTIPSTNIPANRLGMRIFYRTAGSSDAYVPMGRGFYVGDANFGSADTTFQLSRQSELTGSYDLQIRAWFDSTRQGADNVPDVNKLIHAIDFASSGKDRPDTAGMSSATLSVFRQSMVAREHYVQSDKTLDVAGYTNILINGTMCAVDNHWADGRVHVYNSKYLVPILEEGFDTFRLEEGELVDLYDGRAVSSIGGTLIASMQLVHKGLNRGAVLPDFSI